MASTQALFTGLSGLNAHARRLDVIGNNISNVNTIAYKSSRMLFAEAFSRTLSEGTLPGDVTGGTNPKQIGMGVTVAGTQRNFAPGTLQATGDGRDLAIEGDGLFIVRRGDDRFYTRAGAFRTTSENELVNIDGLRVQGFAVDDDFDIIDGALSDLTIPIGSLTIAEATSMVNFRGNLNAAGEVPTQGSLVQLLVNETDGFTLIPAPSLTPTAPAVIDESNLLVDIEDPDDPGSGTPLFSAGQQLLVTGAEKGTRDLPDATFDIDATTTIADLMAFLNAALGIRIDDDNPDGSTPGAQLDPDTGILSIIGNTGGVNDLDIDATDIRLLDSSGTLVGQPFVPTKSAQADGESVRSSFVVYDSLGTPLTVDLTFVLEGKDDTGTTWRFYAESGDDTDVDLLVGSGLVEFDTFGQIVEPGLGTISIDRADTGAATPLVMTLDFSENGEELSSLTDIQSQFAASSQNGSPIGTLTSFGIEQNGIISGVFSNGLTRTLGQIPLAVFTNDEGLVSRGANLWSEGANSGNAAIVEAGSFASGRIVAGALEGSNVDLGQEFLDLILTSTGYSASSRVIRTTDELMQQLLALGR